MSKYICNPLNLRYRYQFNQNSQDGKIQIDREAADPSLILFQGRYYLFPSMSLSFWVSDDLVSWENHALPKELPLYDYAPDVRAVGEYMYFCASNKDHPCDFYRTKDPVRGPFEKLEGVIPFWDPNLFVDEDGRVYFYWGCSAMTPIYGVEMDPATLRPLAEPKELIFGQPFRLGYERCGEDHCETPKTDAEIEENYQRFLRERGMTEDQVPPQYIPMIRGMNSNRPYIEGAWMTKHGGKYYLQYACNGAQWNVYADGVYESDKPLGPFTPARNNPYSYKPGGFLPGAGHGSTLEDRQGNWWHTATMRISVNHSFERRVGLWPAGFDADGELFCNQRYGDWPLEITGGKQDPWANPKWMLLSAGKAMTASSCQSGHEPEKAAEEDIQTWWRAATNQDGEWLQLDLGKAFEVHAIQINFADQDLDLPIPGEVVQNSQARYIDDTLYPTRWSLTGSLDGEKWFSVAERADDTSDLPHDFIVREEGIQVRYLKLTVHALPYAQIPCVSGLRVFGRGEGEAPQVPEFRAERVSALKMKVSIQPDEHALGHVILWGHAPEKMYHSWMTFEDEKEIYALVEGQAYWVRVDAFNENGITEGKIQKI